MEQAVETFKKAYGYEPEVVGIAPGRIEILGNHTDYNDGLILGAAINAYTYVAAGKRVCDDGVQNCRAVSSAKEEWATPVSFDPHGEKRTDWAVYVQGVCHLWSAENFSADFAITSTIPLGSGVSSSAALELAVAKTLEVLLPREISPLELVMLCKEAENKFVGVGCGILDQFTCSFGQDNKILFLDCQDLSSNQVPWDNARTAFVLLQTLAPRQLVDGEYDKRRTSCFSAAKKCGAKTLREIDDVSQLSKADVNLTTDEVNCATHIIGENNRVREGTRLLNFDKPDFAQFGKLLSDSHASSRDYFENSWTEANVALQLAQDIPGFLGGRMMGGGFGGCTLNLVDIAVTTPVAFMSQLQERYREATKLAGACFMVRPSSGMSVKKLKW